MTENVPVPGNPCRSIMSDQNINNMYHHTNKQSQKKKFVFHDIDKKYHNILRVLCDLLSIRINIHVKSEKAIVIQKIS